MLQQATKNYQRLKPQHELLWSEFLQLCLHDPTLTDQHHQAIAQLVLLESLWDSYQHIWVLCNTQTGHSIVAVEYPTLAGTAIATSRDEVEQVLSKALSSWFTTAHVSLFLHKPLVPLVGPYCTGSVAWEILQGTFTCPPGTDEATHHYIKALQFPSQAAQQAHVLAILWPEDFICHRHHTKEHTSSSPLGLHFGHYKAATHAPDIAFLHAQFTQLVFMTSLYLSHYQTGLQVVLEKGRKHSCR